MAMLAGKTVLITGGASGIGRAWAEAFLRDSSPPTVICCDIDEAGLAEVGAQGALTLRTDVTDAAQVKRMIEFAVSETGRLDVLYNNAGVGFHTRVERVFDGEFEQHVAIHLFATVNAMRHSIPIMRAQGSGRIINTCSRNAEGVAIGASAYAAAKAGIWALTRTAAIEAASRGDDILINCLIPGPTNTGIWGADQPQLQPPEATVPTARLLATLPTGSPISGKTYWDEKEYILFENNSAVVEEALAGARANARPKL